jgi:hypothetical protein
MPAAVPSVKRWSRSTPQVIRLVDHGLLRRIDGAVDPPARTLNRPVRARCRPAPRSGTPPGAVRLQANAGWFCRNGCRARALADSSVWDGSSTYHLATIYVCIDPLRRMEVCKSLSDKDFFSRTVALLVPPGLLGGHRSPHDMGTLSRCLGSADLRRIQRTTWEMLDGRQSIAGRAGRRRDFR